MARYFIQLAYDGTQYHGWQIQPNGVSVQEVLEKSLYRISRKNIRLTGCGRTDAGVHARQFFAHFDNEDISGQGLSSLMYSLNAVLPYDITVIDIFRVKEEAHARFDALSRLYRYYFSFRKDPFNRHYTASLFHKPDLDLLNEGARIIAEYHDFTSFSKHHTQTATNWCTVYSAVWTISREQLVFTIKADRFLRNMVRAVSGTLLDLGTGKISLDQLRSIIEKKDRSAAGTSLPAKGLFLEEVVYPDGIWLNQAK